MEFFKAFDLTGTQWILVVIAAFIVGFSRTGVSGMTMLVIPIMASVFGGKESTGVLLPLLVTGDIFAVSYYRKNVEWSDIKKLLPWTIAGLTLGLVVGNYISDRQFKALIGIIVLVCLGILLYTQKKGDKKTVPESSFLSVLTGIAAGFATMIGNVAGPIFSVFLLAKGFRKLDFMGTTAWFFMIINLIKVPLQIFVWQNVNARSFMTAGLMIPAIALGAFVGIIVIRKINEKIFRYLIICLTAIAAIRLFI
jgi:uncharacterized membrane protein YfcA